MMFAGCIDGPFREKFSKLGQTHLFANNNFEYGQPLIDLVHSFNPDIIHIFIPGAQSLSFIEALPKCKLFATVLCGQPVAFDHTKFKRFSSYQNINRP